MWSLSEKTIELLEEQYQKYNQPLFIDNDPISIPHAFSIAQDIEIAGFFASILAWGQRVTIINKCKELFERMDHSPYQFVKHATDSDLKRLEGFRHRTFNDFDLLYFIDFFRNHYAQYDTLEDAFLINNQPENNVKANLIAFRNYFFEGVEGPIRTGKHISSPAKNSACKRINMFLRWMVRKDNRGVDIGLWHRLQPSQLVIPCDVHVETIARHLQLTQRPKADWTMAEEITNTLKTLDAQDPAKYDFALFGMGVENYFFDRNSKKNFVKSI